MFEMLLELVGEAVLEGIAHLLISMALKGFELGQEIWAIFLGR